MLQMDRVTLAQEAEKARQLALSYLGTQEASFLLRVAREFDHLAEEAANSPSENFSGSH